MMKNRSSEPLAVRTPNMGAASRVRIAGTTMKRTNISGMKISTGGLS